MSPEQVRSLARTIYGTMKTRGEEQRSWLLHGTMSAAQERRLGRRTKPPCFESDEQWIAYCIREAQRPVPNSGYCFDCMAAYKQEMLKQGRCDQPLTFFKIVGKAPDHDEVGQHPSTLHRAPPRRKCVS